jgi:Thioredoxin
MISVLVVVVVLAVATAGGLLWRRRDGRLRTVAPAPDGAPAVVVPQSLGVALDAPVTLLQFSSAVCAPCGVAHRVCTQVAADQPGVTHVEVDAEQHLDAARELGIWRTPTVLVVDRAGHVVHRASGVPSAADLRDAISPLLVGA